MDYNRFAAPRRGRHPVSWSDDVEELLTSAADDRQARLAAAMARANLIPPVADPVAVTRAVLPAPAPLKVRQHRYTRVSKPAWMWAVFGFGVGILFWHWIGFWSLVGDIIWPATPIGRHVSAPAIAPPSAEHPTLLPARSVHPHISKPAQITAMAPTAVVEPGGWPGGWNVSVDTATPGARNAP